MGQKIPPKALRLGYIEDWESKWFNLREFPELIEEDHKVRKYLKEKLKFSGVSKIGIERPGKFLRVNIYTARPGMVIGRRGSEIENLRKDLEELTNRKVAVNVLEIKQPETDAQLVAELAAMQIEKRIPHRRAIKQAIQNAMDCGALGIKVMISGRLGGNEIARFEWSKQGRIPLQTFRAVIDYGMARAYNTYGVTGIKVWIFKKELFKKSDRDLLEESRLIEQERIKDFEKEVDEVPKMGLELIEKEEIDYGIDTEKS